MAKMFSKMVVWANDLHIYDGVLKNPELIV